MLITAILLFLAAIVVHLAWPLIKRAAVLGIGLAALAVVVRVVVDLDPRMGDGDAIGPMVYGAFGAAVVCWVFYRIIHNALVRADLARTIERDKAQAKARMI